MGVNRIWIAIAVILITITFYEARLKPQSRPFYNTARNLYKEGKYGASLLQLEKAYKIEPNSTAILALMGWNYLKLQQYKDARARFERATRLNPKLVDAKLGLAFVALETGEGEVPVDSIEALLEQEPRNPDFRLAAAVAYRKTGQNLEALPFFKRLLGRGDYGILAQKNLEEMYGIEKLNKEIPDGLPTLRRSEQLQMAFRAGDRYLQRRSGNAWENVYVKGINLGPAIPGGFATTPPVLVEDYLRWLQQIAQLGANTIRLYTVLPPAFYRALKHHNETANQPPLYLLQEVLLVGPEETNLLQPAVERAARREIARVIDVLHGQGDMPMRRGHASGLYIVDVSQYVLGLLIGPALEPHQVVANNEYNSYRRSHSGTYISLPEGNPTEVWLASMMDYAASYEVEKYNHQRPLSIVNWPQLDPLTHPTDDTVSIDDQHFRTKAAFEAGIFASYHVYPFYPDFLLHESALLQTRDHVGPNSYFGYLKALKAHYSRMPLLIAEYGISTSIGRSRLHPQGWDQGGLNEREQAELLVRLTRNIADAGCAGGVLFEWQDQWSSGNWLTAAFEIPRNRRPLWLNALDPSQNFGLWTYEPSRSRLFSTDASAWGDAQQLYQKGTGGPAVTLNDGADGHRTLHSLSVSSDEAFLYLRLAVQSLPRSRDGTPTLEQANYLIGISTQPGKFGGRLVPGLRPHVRVPEGFNFLLHVGGVGADQTRLLVASNYNPYGLFPVEGAGTRTHLTLRRPWEPVLEDWSPFEQIIVEPNRMRYSRGGAFFPARRYSRSLLRYGPLDRNAPGYDSLATWAADFQNNTLLFRVPWGLLFVTDPSSRQVYGGADAEAAVRPVVTGGLALFALSFRPGASPVNWSRFPSARLAFTDSLPAIDEEGQFNDIRKYRWEEWNTVKVDGRLKAGARALQQSFRALRVPSK